MSDSRSEKLFVPKPSTSVCAEVRVADVLALCPGWSEADAAMFLGVCAENIAAAMLRAGTFELACMIKTAQAIVDAEDAADAK